MCESEPGKPEARAKETVSFVRARSMCVFWVEENRGHAPLSVTLAPTTWGRLEPMMPGPCAVVCHAGFYTGRSRNRDATALCRGLSRWFLRRRIPEPRCHGLVPWSVTLVSTQADPGTEMPRPCAVVRHAGFYTGRSRNRDATAQGRGIKP